MCHSIMLHAHCLPFDTVCYHMLFCYIVINCIRFWFLSLMCGGLYLAASFGVVLKYFCMVQEILGVCVSYAVVVCQCCRCGGSVVI